MDLQQSAGNQDQARRDVSASDAIRSRRNVRQYADRPIACTDLDEILEAARRSPSSKNSQPWDFVVVTDRDRLSRLAGVWAGGKHIAGSAATVALVTSADDAARGGVQFDLGQAAMSIMIAAAGLGIGSCHSAVGDQNPRPRVARSPRGDNLLPADLAWLPGRPVIVADPDPRSPSPIATAGKAIILDFYRSMY